MGGWARGMRRRQAVARLVGLAAALAAGAAAAPPAGARAGVRPIAQPAAQPAAGMVYRHADTWSDVPWTRRAGHFGTVADISSRPNDPRSPIYVLDSRQKAVHVLAPDGAPQAVWDVPGAAGPDDPWIVQRLDVGFDGTLHVLATSLAAGDTGRTYRTRVDRIDPAGRLVDRVEILAPAPYAYRDVAVGADGRVYLSRVVPVAGVSRPGFPPPTPDPRAPLRAVDVLDATGGLAASISPPEMTFPDSLDVAADGTLYVVNRVPATFVSPGPDPTATPRPSLAASVADTADATGDPVEGVLVFAPDHRLRETVVFNDAEDIAVGRAGVFVARHVEVFALRQPGPIFTGPVAYAGSLSSTILHLDVPGDGRLLAGVAHCYAQGVLVFDDPTARPVVGRIAGALDQPELDGPRHPLRVAASDAVAVLLGRYDADRAHDPPVVRARPFLRQIQTVQRWARAGVGADRAGGSHLVSQLGLCTGLDGWAARDVALDGPDLYAVDPETVQRRPDDGLPAWTVAPAALIDDLDRPAYLAAVAADGGRVAVLDTGAGEVLGFDRQGRLTDRWPTGAPGAVPVDLALDARHGRVYLADAGRARVAVRDLDGADRGEWPLHDGPRAVAVGPSGDVFVLGRGGWGLRYRPDGTLVAAWPMPDGDAEALDIAVDVDGRVYVNFARRAPAGAPEPIGAEAGTVIVAAGVWVFEAAPAPAAPPPAASGCIARPDKAAAPPRVALGGSVEVRLRVDGRCPGRHGRTQVVVVLDVSRSMGFSIATSSALQRAREAVLGLVDGLAAGGDGVDVALVTYDDTARVVVPLGRAADAVRQALARAAPDGDSRLAAGLAVAQAELTGPRGDPSARRVVVVVTDGVLKDDPVPWGASLRAAGATLHAWVFVNPDWQAGYRSALQALVGVGEHLAFGPDAAVARRMADGLTGFEPEPGLFETVTVTDRIPANMRYVAGSAAPPAAYDPASHTLAWTLASVAAADGIVLRYRLVPTAVGTWPTNVWAAAAYRDVRGRPGELRFPVPQVEVFAPAGRIYLPLAQRQACLAPDRPLDVVLVMDTSSSMGEPDAGGGQTKLAAAQAAAGGLALRLGRPDDRAAVVAFDASARRVIGLTADRAAVAGALAGLATAAGTRIDLGLSEAGAVLRDAGRPNALPVAIVLTDGLQGAAGGADAGVRRAADNLKAGGVRVYAVGLGDAIDRPLLRAVASSPDRYYESPVAADLDAIYREISARLTCEARP